MPCNNKCTHIHPTIQLLHHRIHPVKITKFLEQSKILSCHIMSLLHAIDRTTVFLFSKEYQWNQSR